MDEDHTYSTRDMKLIVVLLALGHKPVSIERAGRIVYFVFDRGEVEPDVNRFLMNDDIQVSANRFWAGMDIFKTALNS